MLKSCGIILLVWGIFSLVEIRNLSRLIQDKEEQFSLLRKSFDKSEGVTFNPINVRSEYIPVPARRTRSYFIWIEADDAVLEKIDHVKYIFNDSSWHGPSVITGDSRTNESGKAFVCEVGSYASLHYITVLVMYKGYKDRGGIQPINFNWHAEERLAK